MRSSTFEFGWSPNSKDFFVFLDYLHNFFEVQLLSGRFAFTPITIQALSSWTESWKLVKEGMTSLAVVSRHFHIRLGWVTTESLETSRLPYLLRTRRTSWKLFRYAKVFLIYSKGFWVYDSEPKGERQIKPGIIIVTGTCITCLRFTIFKMFT